jgi:hypothetical protein
MADPVNIQPGLTNEVSTGGTAVEVIPAHINGGWITNPVEATESLFVNPTKPGSTTAAGNNGTDFELIPGDTWEVIPGQNTPTYVNAVTNGHVFSVIYW